MERRMHSTFFIMFGSLVKIKSINEHDDKRRWVGCLVIWCSPWKEVINASRVPSILSTSPDHQLENLLSKFPVANSKWALKLFRCATYYYLDVFVTRLAAWSIQPYYIERQSLKKNSQTKPSCKFVTLSTFIGSDSLN